MKLSPARNSLTPVELVLCSLQFEAIGCILEHSSQRAGVEIEQAVTKLRDHGIGELRHANTPKVHQCQYVWRGPKVPMEC